MIPLRWPIVFAALTGALAADPLTDVFGRMDKAAPQFRSMTADITDIDHTAVVNDDSTMKGTYKVKRNKGETRMLIDFTGADARTISLDVSQGQIYFPKIRTVQVYNLGDKRHLIDQFLLLGFGATSNEIKADYEVSYSGAENIGGQAASRIKLIPKSAEVLKQLKQAELWIADSGPLAGMPVQERLITSNAGDFKLVTYSNVKLNPALSDRDLKLNPPKGVQIQQMHN